MKRYKIIELTIKSLEGERICKYIQTEKGLIPLSIITWQKVEVPDYIIKELKNIGEIEIDENLIK